MSLAGLSAFYENETPVPGSVRYNSVCNTLEVYTGTRWVHAAVIEPAVEIVTQWGMKKMAEERRIAQLIEQHPELKKAKEVYDILLTLVDTQENNGDT